jgi:endonuclease/exonuclease/phosphatase family metal-dependent hydrolase
VNALATRHTAEVIADLAPDLLAVIEVEDRPTPKSHSTVMLPSSAPPPMPTRWLSTATTTAASTSGSSFGTITSSSRCARTSTTPTPRARSSARDCPEYTVKRADGKRLIVLVNHLKSKGYGRQRDNDARRRRQAVRVAAIYKALGSAGEERIAVVGDLNDTPDSAALAPLLARTELQDITASPKFTSDGRPGTYGNGTKANKIDFILLSPALFETVTDGGIYRNGVWGGKNGALWPHYPDITAPAEAASGHAAICAGIEV